MRSTSKLLNGLVERILSYDDECGALRVTVFPCGCESIECELGHVHQVDICDMSAHRPGIMLPDRSEQLSIDGLTS